MTTLKILDLVFTILLLMFLVLITYTNFQDQEWNKKCEDAGGIPVSGKSVCINPGSVIEVN